MSNFTLERLRESETMRQRRDTSQNISFYLGSRVIKRNLWNACIWFNSFLEGRGCVISIFRKELQMTCNSSRGSWEVSKKVKHLTVGPLEVFEKFTGGWHRRLYGGWHRRLFGGWHRRLFGGWHRRLYGGLFDFTVSQSPSPRLCFGLLDLDLDFRLTIANDLKF